MSDAAVEVLAGNASKLQQLSLKGCNKLTDTGKQLVPLSGLIMNSVTHRWMG
jgi:hypothetical protein